MPQYLKFFVLAVMARATNLCALCVLVKHSAEIDFAIRWVRPSCHTHLMPLVPSKVGSKDNLILDMYGTTAAQLWRVVRRKRGARGEGILTSLVCVRSTGKRWVYLRVFDFKQGLTIGDTLRWLH